MKVFIGFLLTKLLAVFLGPSGIAVYGNLKNFLNGSSGVVSLGMYKGVVRYASEWRQRSQKLLGLTSTLNVIGVLSSILFGAAVLLFAESISNWVLFDTNHTWVIRMLAITIPCFTFQAFYFSLLNGLGNYKKVLWVELSLNLSNLLITSLLVYFFGLVGGLLALVSTPVFYFFLTIRALKSETQGSVSFKHFQYNKVIGKDLWKYSAMTLFSTLAFPFVFVSIRSQITEVMSITAAGYWEVVNQISYFYFLILNSFVLMYVLPKISATSNLYVFRNTVRSYFLQLMPLFLIFLVLLYYFRNLTISIVFTDQFHAAESLFLWQLGGDFFKAASLVVVSLFHARRMAWEYIATDVFLAFSLYLISVKLLDMIGLEGVVLGHFISYVCYFLIVIFVLRKELFYHLNASKHAS